LGVNVQVDNDTEVTIVVDQASGDRLVLRGGGLFSLAVDRSGETSLTGTYSISGGEYQLSFQNIVRRNFQILGGSNVTWVGDPLDAELNVAAEYNLRTSPVSLVGAYLTEQETTSYRRALPFQVLLELQGTMSEPEISFQLDMPSAERGALAGTVYNRLQQVNENEAERNRQAFALLVFNQFLGEEFTGFDQGAAVASGARSSAARLLSRQLNIISARVVPGLDLSFEIESYEEIGEEGPEGRTELQVQLTRQFFEDRVSIELGGRFELEGEGRETDDVDGFAGDVVVEYLITEDGRYRIRGFQRREYEGPIEGTQATTGVAIVYTRRFDRFLDLFRRPQEETDTQLPNSGIEQDRS
ncbi:MAG: translocation/assembly module TamB, partial [Spirochaeta sp.]|nr:translocation/assembly module TamB [Spirochaeta sp.]